MTAQRRATELAIWDATNGAQNITDILTNLGVDFTGWQFNTVTGLSADGRILTGSGKLNGVAQGWVVVIPEPSTLTILGVGLLAHIRRRK
jgi:hypothetical protein